MRIGWIPAFLASLLAAPAALGAPHAALAPAAAPSGEETDKLKVGSTVPASVTLKDFEGVATSFQSLRGKYVIVHFWSDRCPAERHGDPVFLRMEKQLAESPDVVMIGIASNQNELGPKPAEGADYSKHYGDLRTKRDKVGYSHTILADHGNVVSDLFQARTTPHCYVLDKEGVIRYAGALDDDPRDAKGEAATNYPLEAVKALKAGKEPAVAETKPYG